MLQVFDDIRNDSFLIALMFPSDQSVSTQNIVRPVLSMSDPCEAIFKVCDEVKQSTRGDYHSCWVSVMIMASSIYETHSNRPHRGHLPLTFSRQPDWAGLRWKRQIWPDYSIRFNQPINIARILGIMRPYGGATNRHSCNFTSCQKHNQKNIVSFSLTQKRTEIRTWNPIFKRSKWVNLMWYEAIRTDLWQKVIVGNFIINFLRNVRLDQHAAAPTDENDEFNIKWWGSVHSFALVIFYFKLKNRFVDSNHSGSNGMLM